ncbi:retrovirus-related pol polyprotein from transposon TNT 1-94 [Tanacetum coccineum]
MAYTPQQNRVVERKHRHFLETARALRLHAGLPKKFWGNFILAATYLINKMPMKQLVWKTPFEVIHGKPPSYEALKTIRCLCYAASLGPNRDKFDPKGIRCVQRGYPPESVFPFKEPVTTSAPSTVKLACYPDLSTDEEVDVHEAPNTNPLPNETTEPIHTHEDNAEPLPNTNQPSNSSQNIPTRRSARTTTAPKWLKDFVGPKSFANVVHQQPLYPLFTHDDFKDVPQHHIAFLANVFDSVKPVSYSQACTHKGWVEAMENELAALEQNKTWELIG